MSHYREIDDQKTIDEVRRALPPAAAEIGQQVWWTDTTGGQIYEGRIRRIEYGHYGWPIVENATRRYVAQAERCLWLSCGSPSWSDNTHTWESENMSGTLMDDSWWKFRWTFDDILEKAAEARSSWAEDAMRDAERRRKDADIWRGMKSKQEAA